VLAVIVVGAFALLGLDPYMQLLLWVNSPGVIGIIVLQVLTCIAVVVYFAKHKELARKWYVVPSAVVAAVLQAVVLYILCTSFDLLTASTVCTMPETTGEPVLGSVRCRIAGST
ncbi:hypothetical protein ACC691_37325, partial [Rhizobium johnstonii]|uniref:hypothetical protein n=1 Tax=Rhizobium johnstonii TaxID=3019933 RepID=UPI003F9D1F05